MLGILDILAQHYTVRDSETVTSFFGTKFLVAHNLSFFLISKFLQANREDYTYSYAVVYCIWNFKILTEENPQGVSKKSLCRNFVFSNAAWDSIYYDNLCCRVLHLEFQNFGR